MGGGMAGGMRRGRMGGGMMMGGIGLPEEPVVDQDSMMHESALPEIISDEVRKELQRILPILLREMLPKLLAEAMTKAAGNNNPSQQSMTEPMRNETMAPPIMPPPRTGALTMPPPRENKSR